MKKKHLEYMKIYSEYRHNLMCGYEGDQFYQMIFNGEFIDIVRWLEDYRKENPDYPKDGEIPFWTSIEGRAMFREGCGE